ncbi:glucocorticoid-induced transcript 1 protein isoform X1 [Diachasma alloeum]|uniref:glucocorticoid-induced transcript 1 protein isoform X1 n=1 Tax=Diachasma alloeum TaxID=454923 RepID=UPI0007382178|nr:glucocorticoid-induced transcript 1 protein isoform X1 [Diachasma alloeum]XP_015111375.1 glucocorticoid-induced transcript 1 protein isoform X1 [Diachasma alloeum]XP_015111376.1 glucocorticoid-induced transcript 1 protein isoform X1 [Diachasma alloeum]
MSGSQRMRKSSPCSTTKQGPMRATLPVSSLLRQSRQGSSLRKSNSNSPTVSPTNANAWRARISPDTSASSGQRSPGSLSYKAKSKTLTGRGSDGLSGNQNIRRTASLDTIYLKGQWPRDSYYVHTSLLLVDKSTQTDEWSSEPRKMTHSRHQTEPTNISQDEKLPMDKYIRQRLQRTNKESTSCRERTTAFGLIMPGGPPPALPGDHTVLLPSIASQISIQNQFSLSTKASPMNIPVKPMRTPMRASVEALNQEVEGLVLTPNSNSNDPDHPVEDKYARYREQMTPEGHRAPLADLLRATRSVNTQTPATDLPSSSYSSGPPSRNSESPLIPGLLDTSRPSSDLPQGGSRGSTPDQEREGRLGTSPHINRFLAREPPDGCEKVNLKFVEDARRPMIDVSKLDFHPKPCQGFQLKPSLGSAFLPLQQHPVSPTVISGNQSPSSQVNPSTPPPNP